MVPVGMLDVDVDVVVDMDVDVLLLLLVVVVVVRGGWSARRGTRRERRAWIWGRVSNVEGCGRDGSAGGVCW